MGLWMVFVIASIAIGSFAGTKCSDGGGNVGETARAEQMIDSANFPDDPSVEAVLVTSAAGKLDATAQRAAEDVAGRMRALSGVSKVEPPLASPDGTALLVQVTMAGDPSTADSRVQPLLDTTAAVQRDYPSLRIEEIGDASIDKGLGESVDKDFQRAELFSIPVTLAILLVAFGALIAAAVPVLLALSAVSAAMGLSALASHLMPAQDATSSVILLIGLAVGVDYSLFYLKREREERARGAGHIDAVEIAAATSGRAVVVSGIAVIISMAGMLLANDGIFGSIAVGSILVVAVSVIGSITVLPAMLAKLGRWVDRPRIPLLWRLTAPRKGSAAPRVWPVLLRPALRHPIITFVVSAGALVALAVPALDLTLKLPGLQDFPTRIPVVAAYDRMTAAFPSTGTGHYVVVRADAARVDDVRAALDRLTADTAGDPLFAHDQPPEVTVSPDRTITMYRLGSAYPSGTPEADRSLDELRGQLLPATVGRLDGVEYAVTGQIAGINDYADHTWSKLPLVIGFVLLLTFLVMMWTFRSVVVAITSIALNMLSVGAAYGVLVLVFQHSWAERFLDFRSNGGVVAWLPMFLFVVLFGLSMDYHVFTVSRIREAVLRGVPNREAVATGIVRSAGVVTSAAVVMVGVFAIFGTLSAPELKQLGVGLATAILIDATLIRAVVLPSLMTMLGEANWWWPFGRSTRPAGPIEDVGLPELEPAGRP
jgi:RND superfamily putative drug exporter